VSLLADHEDGWINGQILRANVGFASARRQYNHLRNGAAGSERVSVEPLYNGIQLKKG
jgi:hypothetical protein